MQSQRASRMLLCYMAAMKNGLKQQTRHKSHSCSAHMNARNLSLVSGVRQQLAYAEEPIPDSVIAWATAGQASLRVEFGDGSVNEMPYHWLRNNCRCSKCSGALAGASGTVGYHHHHHNQGTDIQPEIIQRRESGLVVDWSDGHISRYTADWLRAADIINSSEFAMHNYAEAT